MEEAIDPRSCFPNPHHGSWMFSGGSSSLAKQGASRRRKGKTQQAKSHGLVSSSEQRGGFNFSPFQSIEVQDWGAFSRSVGQEGSMFMFSGVNNKRTDSSSDSAFIMSLD